MREGGRPLLAAQHRVGGARRRSAELRGRDPAHAGAEPGLLENRLGELGPCAVARSGEMPDTPWELEELRHRTGKRYDRWLYDMTREEFVAIVNADLPRWAQVIKTLGLKGE